MPGSGNKAFQHSNLKMHSHNDLCGFLNIFKLRLVGFKFMQKLHVQVVVMICPITHERLGNRWEPIASDILQKKKNCSGENRDEEQSGGQKLTGTGAVVHNKASQKSEWECKFLPLATEWTGFTLPASGSQTRSADGECFLSSARTVCVCSLPSLPPFIRRSPLRFFLFCEMRWGDDVRPPGRV